MSGNQYPSDVQFAGLIQAATAAADAQEHNASILGKRTRSQDDSLIDTQLRSHSTAVPQPTGQLPASTPTLQSSASVLFREPSEKSKKYSRPPLGKVYTDLELAPESFLRLQNAAKSYMLDEAHLERRDVVGHKKHSSNNDVAKLRLWNCVEEFLSQDDNGEKWFGHGAGLEIPDTPRRTFFWPEDTQKVIKLCMPLFRKMVTNERQRLYASETRKHDSNKVDKDHRASAAAAAVAAVQLDENFSLPTVASHETSMVNQNLDEPSTIQNVFSVDSQEQQDMDTAGHLSLHINITSAQNESGHRLVPRFTISSSSVTTLSALVAEARQRYDLTQLVPSSDGDWFMPVVKVWLPDGLVRIKDDGQWMVALLSVSMVEWMDAEVRILIELDVDPGVMSIG